MAVASKNHKLHYFNTLHTTYNGMNAVTDLIYFIWLLIYRFTAKYVCFIPYSPIDYVVWF